MIFAVYIAPAQISPFKPATNKGLAKNIFSINYKPIVTNRPDLRISANYYINNLSFFCRNEIKFEAATRVPFRFRLGSVQLCDWQEGKSNSLRNW
ncbi:MAG: hypothetical protein JWQ27_1519 [Ferruginibacter sp.]|nr:hypothetical protein [Ferruginibacter sp.]